MSTDENLPEHVRLNRAHWDRLAADYVGPGERKWQASEPSWGIWDIPEPEARLLPDDLTGRAAIELGCGTAYVSAWLARRGARVTGIDNSPAQLATARRLQAEHRLDFPLLLGNAEEVPLPDGSFDFAISEYGAALWADPHRWIPEAARLLRPGGELTFLTTGFLLLLCMRDLDSEGASTDRLRRSAFGLHRTRWADSDGVEFHLNHGDWIRLLRANQLEILDLVELRPADRATTRYTFTSVEWARRWPSEEVWKARKRG